MNKLLTFIAVMAVIAPGFAMSARSTGASTSRVGASRSGHIVLSPSQIQIGSTPIVYDDEEEGLDDELLEELEAAKEACLANNVGIGNVFVWAAIDSDTSSYYSMVEDTENPENNTCFVRVELDTSNAKVDLSDIEPVYYEMGRNITCGEWADEEDLEQRILKAGKSTRGWAIAGAAIGGAGIGVGAMELFGNELIGGKVEGQNNKNLSDEQVLASQILELKRKDSNQYNQSLGILKSLAAECAKTWPTGKPEQCNIDYNSVISQVESAEIK